MTMLTKWKIPLAFAALLAGLPMAALAQQGMGPGGGQGGGGMAVVSALCGKEIATHCAATPRGPAAWTCLNAKTDALSENCRLSVEGTGPDRAPGSGPVVRLCMSEITKFCEGVEHGSGLVRDCLEKRRAELGQGCAVALDNTGWGRRR